MYSRLVAAWVVAAVATSDCATVNRKLEGQGGVLPACS